MRRLRLGLPAVFLAVVAALRPSPPGSPDVRRAPAPRSPPARAPVAAIPSAAPKAQGYPDRVSAVGIDPREGATREEIIGAVAWLLDRGCLAVNQKDLLGCIALCDRILEIDPHYPVARELREDAVKTWRKEEYWPILNRKIQTWKEVQDGHAIPWEQTLASIFIDRGYLSELVDGPLWIDEDGDISAPNRKLATMRIDIAFEETMVEDILAFIRDFSGLNIVVDCAVADYMPPRLPLNFACKDAVLGDILRDLAAPFGLTYTITAQRVVLLTTSARVPLHSARIPSGRRG